MTLPWAITTTGSHSRSTTASSCSTMIIESPSSRRSSRYCSIWRACVGLDLAADDVDQRRLAGAVGADQAGDTALHCRERGSVDSLEAPVVTPDIADGEDWLGLRLHLLGRPRLCGGARLEPARFFGKDAVGSEPQKQQDQQPHADPLHRLDESLVEDRRQKAGRLQEADRNQKGAENDAPVVGRSTDQNRRQEDERLGIQPRARRPGLNELGENRAADAGDDAADDEDNQP